AHVLPRRHAGRRSLAPRRHVHRGIAVDAADADGDALGMHRPGAGRDLDRHRQSGAAPARDGCRGWPSDRPAPAAHRLPAPVRGLPGARTCAPRGPPSIRNSGQRLIATPQGRLPTLMVATTLRLSVSTTETSSETPLAV